MKVQPFDASILNDAGTAIDFFTNILQSSTEYSIIGKDLDGTVVLWNEGARRMYGYEADEVTGKANSAILHTPEDIALGKPRQMMDEALRNGRWEGVIGRVRKDRKRISARVVITPRHDPSGNAIGANAQNAIWLDRWLYRSSTYTYRFGDGFIHFLQFCLRVRTVRDGVTYGLRVQFGSR